MRSEAESRQSLSLERPFLDGRLALRLSSQATTFPFVDFAQALVDEYRGSVLERLGALGMDEVYWDIQLQGQVLTLHSEQYLGVFLCATDEASEQLLRRVVPFAEGYLQRRRTGVGQWLKRAWRRARALFGAATRA